MRHFYVSGLRKKKLFRTREVHVDSKIENVKIDYGTRASSGTGSKQTVTRAPRRRSRCGSNQVIFLYRKIDATPTGKGLRKRHSADEGQNGQC